MSSRLKSMALPEKPDTCNSLNCALQRPGRAFLSDRGRLLGRTQRRLLASNAAGTISGIRSLAGLQRGK